jgi:hypothetical protein
MNLYIFDGILKKYLLLNIAVEVMGGWLVMGYHLSTKSMGMSQTSESVGTILCKCKVL